MRYEEAGWWQAAVVSKSTGKVLKWLGRAWPRRSLVEEMVGYYGATFSSPGKEVAVRSVPRPKRKSAPQQHAMLETR